MNRREALSATALLFGGTIIGAEVFLTGCKQSEQQGELFGAVDLALLDEVADTIIPTTPDSPGAKTARLGDFMKIIVTECYADDERKIFEDGIKSLRQTSDKMFGSDFLKLTAGQKHSLVVSLDKEAKSATNPSEHYFTMIKQLTVWGYFTSEPGATKALRYVPVPGRYDGCIPYKEGEKAWA